MCVCMCECVCECVGGRNLIYVYTNLVSISIRLRFKLNLYTVFWALPSRRYSSARGVAWAASASRTCAGYHGVCPRAWQPPCRCDASRRGRSVCLPAPDTWAARRTCSLSLSFSIFITHTLSCTVSVCYLWYCAMLLLFT